MDRREFLRTTSLAALGFSGWLLPRPSFAGALLGPTAASDSPIQSLSGAFSTGTFTGDDVQRPHDFLWNREQYIRAKGGRPTTFTSERVVVVGGGMGGLLSAHLLRGERPLLLEQAARFGGNSQGERLGGATFSLGAAYITPPEPGGRVERLLGELGLERAFRREAEGESRVLFAGGLRNLWAGETAPEARVEIAAVHGELSRILREAYPAIPWRAEDSGITRAELVALDAKTAHQWLAQTFPRLHPHVREYFQLYCWSSFGGSLEELSAAQFLNFVAAETEGVVAFPGGNAAIARALHASLRTELGAERVRAGCAVLDIKPVGGGTEILFDDESGQLRLVRARAVVVAAPKYAARYMIPSLPPSRARFWADLTYRGYVVANVRLRERVAAPAYDVYALRGTAPDAPSFGRRTDRDWTDLTFANWASEGNGGASVLTLFRPYPFDGARGLITGDIAHSRIHGEITRGLTPALRELGIGENAIDGVRLTRWGHALPLARPGMLSDSSLAQLNEPHGQISFANQDCFMNPCFESAFAAAEQATAHARGWL